MLHCELAHVHGRKGLTVMELLQLLGYFDFPLLR